MKRIAITQRVEVLADRSERRDALDQRWAEFLLACGLSAVPVPNNVELARRLFDSSIAGLILTGGNDLTSYGGDAPERDATERLLVDLAQARGLPILGVCRGMQLLLDRYGVTLVRVTGHVASTHDLLVDGVARKVNSYHHLAALDATDRVRVTARADDGVVEAFADETGHCAGIMWHPERCSPFDPADIESVRHLFGVIG